MNERYRKSFAKRQETNERHACMNCKVFETKVVSSKLNREQKCGINTMLKEAKWCFNSLVADHKNFDYRAKTVMVKKGDELVEELYTILPAQVKQELKKEYIALLKGLKTKKQQGEKVGAVKYISVRNSLPLLQHGVSYKIIGDKHVSIAKIKKPLYVLGLKQIPADAEIANARLVRRASGLYIQITTFVPKVEHVSTGKDIGIDFGIENNLTLSDGTTYNINVSESKATKLASKRASKAYAKNGHKKSNRYRKLCKKRAKAYEHDANKRIDLAHKVVHNVLTNYDHVVMQDELLHRWHKGWFGKQVQHSSMGLIKAELKSNSRTYVIESSFPSTQLCPKCGNKTKHSLDKREYDCPHCGYHHDSRDVKSANTLLDEWRKRVSPEQRA